MKKYRYVLFLGFFAVLAAGVVSGAERPVSVTASVDKDKVNIGDRVKLTVAVPQAAGFELEFPEAPQNLGDFSFIGSRPVKSRLGIPSKTGRAYVMGIYSTGTHVIPPIEVKYRKPGDNEWQSGESPQVPIEVESLLTGEYSDIRDIKGPFFPRKKILQEAATVFALLCAGAVIWVLWRRKARAESMEALKAKPADEIAYEELNRLREMKLPEKGEVREYYFRLSGIVRHYLENRFSYRAPEMTTEEFLGLLKNSAELKGEHKKLLKGFLSHCDMVKFAKYGSTLLEMLDSFKSAERLVDQTRGIEEEAGT